MSLAGRRADQCWPRGGNFVNFENCVKMSGWRHPLIGSRPPTDVTRITIPTIKQTLFSSFPTWQIVDCEAAPRDILVFLSLDFVEVSWLFMAEFNWFNPRCRAMCYNLQCYNEDKCIFSWNPMIAITQQNSGAAPPSLSVITVLITLRYHLQIWADLSQAQHMAADIQTCKRSNWDDCLQNHHWLAV